MDEMRLQGTCVYEVCFLQLPMISFWMKLLVAIEKALIISFKLLRLENLILVYFLNSKLHLSLYAW